MTGSGAGPTDEQILSAFGHIEGCIPDSAPPRTEAVVRQVLTLCIEQTSPDYPKKAITDRDIVRNCSGIKAPATGRDYIRRMAGQADGWECIPGFDLRQNKQAYDWSDGKLELLFDRAAYAEGRTLPGEWTIRHGNQEDD
jgi:hypothetical protein